MQMEETLLTETLRIQRIPLRILISLLKTRLIKNKNKKSESPFLCAERDFFVYKIILQSGNWMNAENAGMVSAAIRGRDHSV